MNSYSDFITPNTSSIIIALNAGYIDFKVLTNCY